MYKRIGILFIFLTITINGQQFYHDIDLNGHNIVKSPFHLLMPIQLPSNNENITIFRSDNYSYTLQLVNSTIITDGGGNDSIAYQLYISTDRSDAAPTAVFSSAQMEKSTTSGTDRGTFAYNIIPANSYLWIVTTAVYGTIKELYLTFNIIRN